MTIKTETILMLTISFSSGILAANSVSWFIKPRKGILRMAAIYIIFCCIMANKSWIGDENIFLMFPFFLACFLLCYEGPKLGCFVMGMIFFSLIEPICMMIDTMDLMMFRLSPKMFQIYLALIKLLVWFIIWLLLRLIITKKEIYPLPKSFWMLLAALSLAPLFSILSFSIWQKSSFDSQAYMTIAYRIAYTTLPFTVISALALLVAVVVLSRHERLKQKQKLAEMQEVYYQGIKREQLGIRGLRHDLHNHLAAAQGLLERGDNDGAKRYLEEISSSPAMLSGKRYCENEIANAVISSKMALMEQHEIEHKIEASIPQGLPFPDVELCALLGNALDNAIEAAAQAAQKRITLLIRTDKGMLMLRVDNTLKQAPRLENGKLVTTKKDAAAHGQGFSVMKKIAKLHDGICEADYTNESFQLMISIPLLQN